MMTKTRAVLQMCKFHAWWDSGKAHIHHTATDTNVLNYHHRDNDKMIRIMIILIRIFTGVTFITLPDTNVLNDHHCDND